MADADLGRALDNLVALGAFNRAGADAFLASAADRAHRDAMRRILVMHWKAADERAKLDPKTAVRIRHELKLMIEAIGWELGIDFP